MNSPGERNGAHAFEHAQEALEIDVLAGAGHALARSVTRLAVGGASGLLHLVPIGTCVPAGEDFVPPRSALATRAPADER